jgi:hypothetical protein
LLTSTSQFDVFEILRIPYQVALGEEQGGPTATSLAGLGRFHSIRSSADGEMGSSVWWPDAEDSTVTPALHWLGEIPIFVELLPARSVDAAAQAGGWERLHHITDGDGGRLGSIWRMPAGDVVLPFNPNRVIRNYLAERYAGDAGGGPARRAAVRVYYRLRPVMPRSLQIGLRRRFSAVQARTRFPRWPQEPGLHDFLRTLYTLVSTTTATELPWIAPWPSGYDWAVVLTHDVETEAGYRRVDVLRNVESSMGFRSSWNFVPRRYAVSDERVAELVRDGCEVGLHGLYHDGRDLESDATLAERLPEMRSWAERWGATGFRSPATHRRWEWMGQLGFDYDSSYPDTDPYEPQPGGCGSLWPFFIDDTVELPITMSQDHTLFVILRHPDIRAWTDKAGYIRERNGMALMLTHPDYLATDELVERYQALLSELADDRTAWRALPREVSDWWRRRAASRLEPDGEGWIIVGPAAVDGAVMTSSPA